MKNLFLLLSVMTLTLTSCSNDDDASQDPLIGTWTFHQYFTDEFEIALSACEKQHTIIINANGTLSSEDFIENGQDTCTSEGVKSGLWSNLGNSEYQFTLDGESETSKIIFEANTFYIEDTFEGETEKTVYIRN